MEENDNAGGVTSPCNLSAGHRAMIAVALRYVKSNYEDDDGLREALEEHNFSQDLESTLAYILAELGFDS